MLTRSLFALDSLWPETVGGGDAPVHDEGGNGKDGQKNPHHGQHNAHNEALREVLLGRRRRV